MPMAAFVVFTACKINLIVFQHVKAFKNETELLEECSDTTNAATCCGNNPTRMTRRLLTLKMYILFIQKNAYRNISSLVCVVI